VWISQGQSYLGRALGFKPQLEIDYQTQQVEQGDIFLLATDGVYEHVSEHDMAGIIRSSADAPEGLDAAAKAIVEKPFSRAAVTTSRHRSCASMSCQAGRPASWSSSCRACRLPPILTARTAFDGYTVIREVHGSSRSHIYLATDNETGALVILKTPSIDLGGDPAYLERFLTEEWIARRINSAHVLKPYVPTRKRHYVYVATEYIDGQTLGQWMIDNPRPGLEAVRGLVEQIAKGLLAFHRLEMLHQDLRPENVMIDKPARQRSSTSALHAWPA
jgi:hypothetical protein